MDRYSYWESSSNDCRRKQRLSSIHRAIRDGAYEYMEDLIATGSDKSYEGHQPAGEILWEVNVSGWTAVHFAATHFLPSEWWEWILVRAAAVKREGFSCQRTALGQSVFDVFLKTYFDPLPWQCDAIKNRSAQLRESLEILLINQNLVQSLISFMNKRQQQQKLCRSPPGEENTGFRYVQIMPSCVTVYRIASFLEAFDCLCRAAAFGHPQSRSRRFDRLRFVCQHIGGSYCPYLLVKLMLALDPKGPQQLWSSNDIMGGLHLPLHLWANSEQHMFYCNTKRNEVNGENNTLVTCLVAAFPEAAQMPVQSSDLGLKHEGNMSKDLAGRLPMHLALATGHSWSNDGGIQILFEAYPESLQYLDPVTRLPPVALAAIGAPWQNQNGQENDKVNQPRTKNVWFSKSNSHVRALENVDSTASVLLMRARQICVGDKGLISVWQMLSKERRDRAVQVAQTQLDCEHINTIYQVLRAYPRALDSCTWIT